MTRTAVDPARSLTILLTAAAVLLPLGLVAWQSLLSAPFFMPDKSIGLDAFRFIFDDADFAGAFKNSLLLACGMAIIAVPLGGVLAFLMVRTDLPGRTLIEPLVMVPIFLSPLVLGFGYVVATGPVGFYTLWAQSLLGLSEAPWNVYAYSSIVVIAGLTHVPHVYLYTSTALRSLPSDLEEAARCAGAKPWQVALHVSLPMVLPALLYAGVLVFFLGFEVFGLVLVLGDPEGHLVLPTYLYKLTNKLGTPSYHLMAAVAVCIVGVTLPLVMLQRLLLKSANKYASIGGKGGRQRPLPLGAWRWPAAGVIAAWLAFSIFVPLSGLILRSFVSGWGEGVHLLEVLTVEHFRDVADSQTALNAIVNTVLIGVVGGALTVACYAAIGLAAHRRNDGWTRLLDYLVMLPRAVPGLLAGLAFLWVFLFFPPLAPLRTTIFSVWLAYSVVWLAYGMRLVSSALLQVAPELEEAARISGANRARSTRDVTLPLIRYGLLGSWLLMFLIFEREYSTGVYLLGPGTEVVGSMLVSLWGSGALDQVAALAVINVALVCVGLGLALRFGINLRH